MQHIRAARGQGLIINSLAPLREGGRDRQKRTSLPANSVSKAGRPFEKPAVVVGVMPTAKRALVQLSRRHAWKRTCSLLGTSKDDTLSLQSGACQAGVNSCQVGLRSAPLPRARAAEGGPHTHLRQQITSAETCEDVRPEHGHPPPPRGGRSVTAFTKVHSRTTRGFRTSALGHAAPMTWSMGRTRVALWRGSAGPPAVHDRPAFPVATTPD